MPSALWLSCFLMGLVCFAPLDALMLCIDYYDIQFGPTSQAVVKLSAIYDGLFTLSQLLCYVCESRLQVLSHQRIVWRLVPCCVVLCLMILYDRVLLPATTPAPGFAFPILSLASAAFGLMDGVAVGAAYGESGMVGPSTAHAMVAGTGSSFLLLVGLRCLTKAALPATVAGVRTSFCIYSGVCCLLMLAALVSYVRVVRPAVDKVQTDAAAHDKKLVKQMSKLAFNPLMSRGGISYVPSTSMRAMPIIAWEVPTDVPPSLLKSKTFRALRLSNLSALGQLPSSHWDATAAVTTAPGGDDTCQLKDTRALPVAAVVVAAEACPRLSQSFSHAPRQIHDDVEAAAAAGLISRPSLLQRAARSANARLTGLLLPHRLHQQQQQQQRRASLGSSMARTDGAEDAFVLDLITEDTREGPEPSSSSAAGGSSSGAKAPPAAAAAATPDADASHRSNKSAKSRGRVVMFATGSGGSDAGDEEPGEGAAAADSRQALRAAAGLTPPAPAATAAAVPADGRQMSGRTASCGVSSARFSEADESPFVRAGGFVGLLSLLPNSLRRQRTGGSSQYAASSFASHKAGTAAAGASPPLGFFARRAASRASTFLTSSTLRSRGGRPSVGLTTSDLLQLRSGELQLQDVLELEPAVVRYNVAGSTVWSRTAAITRDCWVFMLAVVAAYLWSFIVFPGVLSYIEWPAMGGWGSLIIQAFYGVGDLVGKCLPICEPARPRAAFGLAAAGRGLFVPIFIAGLLTSAGPGFFAAMMLLLTFSAGYESSVFALACAGLHHEDAFLVESVLAVMVQLGSLAGALLSLLLQLGPWAADAGGGSGVH